MNNFNLFLVFSVFLMILLIIGSSDNNVNKQDFNYCVYLYNSWQSEHEEFDGCDEWSVSDYVQSIKSGGILIK